VHSAGLPEDEVPALATTLLAGGDLGPGAVVVDVASFRRTHGRLAALYPPGDGAMGDERSMLAAYASHAAGALDLLIALEQARQEADRAGALLVSRTSSRPPRTLRRSRASWPRPCPASSAATAPASCCGTREPASFVPPRRPA
jgi:hypothetical protein